MARTQLTLELPVREKPDKNAFDIRPKKLEKWISELPRANLGETARLVYKTLKETNQLAYSYPDRVQFLEAMREPVFYITDTMKKYYIGVNFPMSEKNHKVAEASREIFAAMATGYKIALEDQLKSSILFSDKKLLSRLIHRALTMIGHVLLTAYRSYEPFPENCWYDAHQLYSFAETNKLIHNEVNDSNRAHVQMSTIQQQYLRLLLIHLASPYRLRQGEVGKIYNKLEHWTQLVKLNKKDNSENSGFFGVNLASYEPPRSLVLATEQGQDEHCRIIETQPLAATIRDEIQNKSDMTTSTLPGIDMQREELSHDLLRRLLIAWGIIPKRVFPRSEKEEAVQITLGLSSSHKVINDNDSGDQYQTQTRDVFINTAKFDTSTVANVNDVQPDVWGSIYPGGSSGQTQPVAEPKFDDSKLKQDAAKHYKHVETWAMLNESAGGYCLRSDRQPDSNIQVGELVGVQRSSEDNSWKWGIAVVRWMKNSKHEGLLLGVEMLNPMASAIGIKSAFSDEHDTYRRTLMLPDLPAINQPKTLITGPVPYRTGNQLIMRCLGKEIPVVLKKQLQNTGFFAQFEFDIVNSHENPETKKPQESKKSDDFDNVWSLI